MDFSLSDEQAQIQTATDTLLEAEGGIELARRTMEGDSDVVGALWAALAENDYTALTVPTDYGGLGDGMVNLALFLEAAGRHAMPGPVPETLGVAVPLVDALGTAAQKQRLLTGIADGDIRTSVALYDDGSTPLPEAITMDATKTTDGYRLDGTKTLVPYADDVDEIVLAARTQNAGGYRGLTLFLVNPDVASVQPLDSFDKTRPQFELAFDGVVVGDEARLGPAGAGGSALREAVDCLNLARCAMLVGGMDAAVDRSVEYANEREQFGHPIGRFQAVKHRIADMWMDAEAARSLTYHAAWAIENDEPEAARAVSEATWYCTAKGTDIFADDLFNHGATGFTWEHDTHIFLKQAKAWENLLGSPEEHQERIAEATL